MLLLVLTGILIILWVWLKRNKNKDEPPLGFGAKMIIGHALDFAGDSVRLWESITRFSKEALQRGGVLKTTVGPRVLYFLSDPEDFATVANDCLDKDSLYDFAKPFSGDGLVTSSVSTWKLHRKLLNPAFSQQVLHSFMDVFNNQARCLVNDLKVEVGKGPFDHWEYTKRNALETICLTALGLNFKEISVTNIEYLNALSNVLNIFTTRFQNFWMHSDFLFGLSSLKRKQDECIKILHSMSDTILKQKKESFNDISKADEKSQKFRPFMELLLEVSRDSDVFTDRAIREHVDTIIVAGHDTSATVIMLCMFMVGSHPRVQEKILEELNLVFGDDDRDVTKQDLSKLVYLEAVIKETMRLHPVVPVIARQLHKDMKLANYTVSKGKTVIMSIYGVYRHSMWGPDVEEFRPERFLDPSAMLFGSFGFTAFGMGRRTCIGKAYVMMSLKITLAHFYRNYKVHSDHTKLKLKVDVMLKPYSGYYIELEKRN